MQAREKVVEMLKFDLKRAQDKMKSLTDNNIRDRNFEEGVWVYVKLQPYKQVTDRQSSYNKLLANAYGLFKIVENISSVAYKLQLPSGSQSYLVFHVSQLKFDKPDTLLMCDNEGPLFVFPMKIIDRRLDKVNNNVVAYVLLQ
ncbi:hypothetical protein Tco_1025898 [Tanacetum coccineum]